MVPAFYIYAISLGFFSSFHCAGMCGPLALMLPQKGGAKIEIFLGRLIYNLGRAFTYVVLGVVFGLIGLSFALKGFQNELSILIGITILLILLFSVVAEKRLRILSGNFLFSVSIRRALKKLYVRKSRLSLFLIGVLNGLLPCGFVYLAISGATTSGSLAGGMLYMSLFALGTFPIMMILSLATSFLGLKLRKSFSRISAVITISLGLILILRGMPHKKENCYEMRTVIECKSGK